MQLKSVQRAQRLAACALLGGATGIGFAPIFVRLSEVGPSATAFYRLLFALPFLWLVSSRESVRFPDPPGEERKALAWWPCLLAGGFFAADLAFWHWSIRWTSVANSTLLTNCAPFFVMLGARVLFGERITRPLVIGMLVAALGTVLLVGTSLQLTRQHLLGDLLALVTAMFYGGYLLTIKHLRRTYSTARVLAWSGVISCALLWLIALVSQETIRIVSLRGFLVLLGLSLVSHLAGQGLIAYALAHLPAGFSAVGLLLQPVVAAVLAWILLQEPLNLLQVSGGITILTGIALAARAPFSAVSRSDRAGSG